MNDRTVKQKVVCYIVRGDDLLVFRHLDEAWDESGLQVPAGSIEVGESPEDAALREAREETGLRSLRLVRKLGESDYDLSPYRDEVQHRHVFELAVDGETPPRWSVTRTTRTTARGSFGSSASGFPSPVVMSCPADKELYSVASDTPRVWSPLSRRSACGSGQRRLWTRDGARSGVSGRRFRVLTGPKNTQCRPPEGA